MRHDLSLIIFGAIYTLSLNVSHVRSNWCDRSRSRYIRHITCRERYRGARSLSSPELYHCELSSKRIKRKVLSEYVKMFRLGICTLLVSISSFVGGTPVHFIFSQKTCRTDSQFALMRFTNCEYKVI